jgi:hypothetical protein
MEAAVPEESIRPGESEDEGERLEDLDVEDEASVGVRGGRRHEDDEQQDITYL